MSFFSFPSQNEKKILLREWVSLSLVLGFFALIVGISFFSRINTKKTLESYVPSTEQTITIYLKGAIEKPGLYTCTPGTTLGALLKDAGISANANRKKIPFKKVFFSSCEIEIPLKKSSVASKKKISLVEK